MTRGPRFFPILWACAIAAAPGAARADIRFLMPPTAMMAPALMPSLAAPGLQCRQAIAAAERAAHTPPHLLAAIGRIESGRRDSASGEVSPWPWSINVEGTDHVYDTKAEAIAAVQKYQAAGRSSIDVGCMQVNLMYHPDAFASLDAAFDPPTNAAYAARFLTQLFQQTGSWEKATAWYHSATPGIGDDYQRKVAAALPDEQRMAGTLPAPAMRASLPMDHPRIIPMPGMGGGGALGRTLDSYRSFPIALASRR